MLPEGVDQNGENNQQESVNRDHASMDVFPVLSSKYIEISTFVNPHSNLYFFVVINSYVT